MLWKPLSLNRFSLAACNLAGLALVSLAGTAHAGDFAQAGSRSLSTGDLTLRWKIEQAYRAAAPVTSATAAVLLLQEALAGEVARSLGLEATTTECERLAAYAEATTQAPDLLAEIQGVFGNDRSSLLRIYFAPRVVDRKLRAWFVHNRQLHREPIRAIEAVMARAQATSLSLEALASRHNLDYTTFTLADSPSAAPPPGLPVRLEFRPDPLLDLLKPLRPGETYRNIVENDVEFRVVRLLAREGTTTMTAESVVAKKAPYEDWYREQVARIPVVIHNRELERQIRREYPSVPW